MIEGSGSRAGSGSIPLTSGSGSGRPKNMWIRIQNTARSHRHNPHASTDLTLVSVDGTVHSCSQQQPLYSQHHCSFPSLRHNRVTPSVTAPPEKQLSPCNRLPNHAVTAATTVVTAVISAATTTVTAAISAVKMEVWRTTGGQLEDDTP
jgi:hypothetical protein